jgi:hypothetical protein
VRRACVCVCSRLTCYMCVVQRTYWYKTRVESSTARVCCLLPAACLCCECSPPALALVLCVCAVELKLRVFHCEKVTVSGATIPAQLLIKKLPATGELLICVVSGDLPFEYQSDIGACKVRALDVEVETIASPSPSHSPSATATATATTATPSKAGGAGSGSRTSTTSSSPSPSASPSGSVSSLGSASSLLLKTNAAAGPVPTSASAALGASAAAAAAAGPVMLPAGTVTRTKRARFILAFRTDGKRMVFQSASAKERDECVETLEEFIAAAPAPTASSAAAAPSAPDAAGKLDS